MMTKTKNIEKLESDLAGLQQKAKDLAEQLGAHAVQVKRERQAAGEAILDGVDPAKAATDLAHVSRQAEAIQAAHDALQARIAAKQAEIQAAYLENAQIRMAEIAKVGSQATSDVLLALNAAYSKGMELAFLFSEAESLRREYGLETPSLTNTSWMALATQLNTELVKVQNLDPAIYKASGAPDAAAREQLVKKLRGW